MPSLSSCCPDGPLGNPIEYSSTMTAEIYSDTPASCGLYVRFSIGWDGSQWKGSYGRFSVSLGCGIGPGELLS